jgi:hypothetical protein
MTYIHVINATNDIEFYLWALPLVKYTGMTTPQTKQIGNYTVNWQKQTNGTLILVSGYKLFCPREIEFITETIITLMLESYRINWTHVSETDREKNKANFNARFEAGRKIVTETEKEDKQTIEHINLLASALKKNPSVISVALKEHPEVLTNIVQSILPSILEGILPNLLRTELQDLRKELTSSLDTKLITTIRAMIQ